MIATAKEINAGNTPVTHRTTAQMKGIIIAINKAIDSRKTISGRL
jgi:hypothetical protein